jgi:hypothetical protein
MIEVISDICACGHFMHKHMYMQECIQVIPDLQMGRGYYTSCACKKYHLDNLTLIERLAEARGLI